MNALDVAREVFPDASDDELEGIVWNRTGWPCFWRGRRKTVIGELRLALREYRDALARLPEGRRLCDLCNRRARLGEDLCGRCERALEVPA